MELVVAPDMPAVEVHGLWAHEARAPAPIYPATAVAVAVAAWGGGVRIGRPAGMWTLGMEGPPHLPNTYCIFLWACILIVLLNCSLTP